MCLIVDANLASLVFNDPPKANFKPLLEWLTSPQKNGRLVVGGQLALELSKVSTARRFVRALAQAGRALIIPDAAVAGDAKAIRPFCHSNDAHVIALARVSGARILCSEDQELHKDFMNPKLISRPRGHIYQTAKHERLLRLYGHTPACKVRERKAVK